MRLRSLVVLPALAGTAFVVGRRRGGKEALEQARREARQAARQGAPTAGGKGAGQKGGQAGPGRSGAVPGVDAEKPTDIPAEGWKQILKRAWKETKQDNVGLLAAGIAYYAFLALFPALIAAITIYGLVADPAQVAEQIESLASGLPEATRTLLTEQLTTIATTSDGALGVGLVVGVLGALFSASGGVANLIKATNLAYDEEETRGGIKVRALALLLTLGAIVFIVVAVGLVAVLPAVLDSIGLGTVGQIAVNVLRWVGLVVFAIGALSIIYRYAPDRDNPQFKWSSLGAVVATVLWILGSAAFSFYVGRFGSYQETYGAIAGVAVLLLWLFLTSFIVLLGAEINAEAEQQTEKDTTEGPPQPMGKRDAVAADSLAPGPP